VGVHDVAGNEGTGVWGWGGREVVLREAAREQPEDAVDVSAVLDWARAMCAVRTEGSRESASPTISDRGGMRAPPMRRIEHYMRTITCALHHAGALARALATAGAGDCAGGSHNLLRQRPAPG
jgi:hypothetical protein